VILLIGLLPTASLAQSTTSPVAASTPAAKSEAREKVRAACAADAAKYCSGVERAKGAMRSCLQTHEAELSDACKAARSERVAERAKEKS
jgi:hypothetical protein